LNEAQRAAVEYIDGPSLVIAGAGSGKTRVLTYKIAYLLSQGMKPWSIMALTFTNKAAREMKERIGKLVGNDLAQHLYMGTFHSIFSRILRAEAEHIGFNNNFTIYDESDSRSLIKAIVKEMGLDDKKYKPAAVHAKISMAKNNLMSAAAYESDAAIFEQNKRAQMPEVGKIFVAYVQRCKQANAMDFDDLLTLTYQLFREHEDIRHKYAARFDYVLVDEYQDTNHVQMSIVMQLCQQTAACCCANQRERIQIYLDATCRRPFINHDINAIVFHGRIKIFFHHGRQAMNFINKEYIIRFETGQHTCQISRFIEHRTGGYLKADSQLVGNDI
jgi:DNA helicase-2/ATP-dependent DNA helicase PcrA